MTWRTELVERMPWVRRLKKAKPCDGVRWGQVPGKALYNWGPGKKNPPIGVDKWRCKRPAHWRFTAMRKSRAAWPEYPAKSGTYCWSHLISLGLHGSMREDERTMKWIEQNAPEEASGGDRA